MGLFDNFSFDNVKNNLLGASPEEQSKSLLGISSALRSPLQKGESAFGNVSQAILGGGTERAEAAKGATALLKKEARQRANDFAGLVPAGKTFNNLSVEDQAKVQSYIQEGKGAYGDLFSLDFGTGAGGKAVSPYGKQATDEGLTLGSPEFETRVTELSKAAKTPAGSAGTSSMENVNALIAHRVRLQKEVTAGTMTQDVMNERMDIIRQQLGGGTDKGKTALANANVENLETQWVKYDTDSDLATDNMATINQSIQLLDSGVYTGFGGEAMADLQNLGVSLGFSPPDANVGAEQFRVNSMKSVMDWIALTKGAISEKEMALFAAASPGLSRTVEGNRMILATAKKAAEWKMQRSSAYNEWYLSASKDGNIPNSRVAKNYIKSWEKAHQLVLPSAADIKAAKEGTKVAAIAATKTGGATTLPPLAVSRGVTQAMWDSFDQATKDLYTK